MNIQTLKLSQLKAAAYNPRKISDRALERLEKSIDAFGLVEPIIVNKRSGFTVVGGHQRLKILEKRGASTVECVVVDLPPGREKLLNVALNNPNLAGTWDEKALQEMLEELAGDEVDVELTGFDASQLAEFTALSKADKPDAPDPDLVPAAPPDPVSQPGDIWYLGTHTIVCGDATKPEIYQAMKFRKAQLVFTDPPYGVDYVAPSGKHAKIANDAAAGDRLSVLLTSVFKRLAAATSHNAAFYVWHASATRDDFAFALKAAGLEERQYIIWAKPSFSLGHSDYQWAHEPCFYAAKAGQRPLWTGDRAQHTVWRVVAKSGDTLSAWVGPGILLSDGAGDEISVTPGNRLGKSKSLRRIRVAQGKQALLSSGFSDTTVWEVGRDRAPDHPTQKPVELARIAITNSSRTGDLVLDPFLGSGSTLMGAEISGRICFGIELEPRYVDVAVRRWQLFTGKKAKNLVRSKITIA